MYQNQLILSKIVDYCKKVGHPIKKSGKITLLECPYCNAPDFSANVIPNTNTINCLNPKCRRRFNLANLVNEIECQNYSEDEAVEYLKKFLELDFLTKKDEEKITKLLDRYDTEHLCLVPCAKKDKVPIQNDWTNKENRNKEEWASWITNGLNISARTGAVSGITVVDFDFLSNAEKIALVKEITSQERKDEIIAKKHKMFEAVKHLIGETWIQETLGGYHAFYKYINLPKTRIKMEDYFIDLENDGGIVVIPPAPETAVKETYDDNGTTRKRVVGYGSRDFINDLPIAQMPQELEEMLLENAPTVTQYDDADSIAQQKAANAPSDFHLDLLDDGDGRNMFFTSYGGYLLHRMPSDYVEYALHGLNARICKTKLDAKEIRATVRSLESYDDAYASRMERDIMEYLNLAEDFVGKADVEIAVLNARAKGEEKKKIDETLVRLIKDGKIIKKGRNYKAIADMEWNDNITDVGVPIDFKMPYFHDYANFNWGDLVLIGALTKVGKTTIAMNVVKRLVTQGIKPYYIYSENGGRYKNHALSLGLKDGDFFKPPFPVNSIEEVTFKKGRNVTIWDWIDPEDFARTNQLFAEICKKVEKSQGLLIAFMQLKEPIHGQKEPQWFAPNMVKARPAIAVKYMYETEDGQYGRFKIDEVREAKPHGKKFDIPTVYDWKNHEVLRLDELSEDKQSGE